MHDEVPRADAGVRPGELGSLVDLTDASARAALGAQPLPGSVLFLNWRDTGHPEGGGSEVYVEHMAAGLAARGVDVTMFCARYPGSSKREHRDGITFVRRGGRFTVYVWALVLYVIGRLGRPAIVVEVQNGMPFLASVYSRRPVVVLVHHVHREQWRVVLPRPLAAIGWWLESRVAPRANRRHTYITVSRSTKAELALLGVDPAAIHVVHNGTTVPPHSAVPPARSAHPTVAVVGRLVPHKRVELAMDAVAELATTLPGLVLVVVGSGWWSGRLAAHAREAGITERTRFTGFVSEADKRELLASSWVLAVPSVKEGWGLVVVEAAAHRTPTVGFRSAGGLTESVHDGVGGILADDYRGFVEALGGMLSDEDLRARLGQGARAHAFTFTWEGSVRAFGAVLSLAAGLAAAQPRTVTSDEALTGS